MSTFTYTKHMRQRLTQAVAEANREGFLTRDEFDRVLEAAWRTPLETSIPVEVPHWTDPSNPDSTPKELISLALDFYGLDR